MTKKPKLLNLYQTPSPPFPPSAYFVEFQSSLPQSLNKSCVSCSRWYRICILGEQACMPGSVYVADLCGCRSATSAILRLHTQLRLYAQAVLLRSAITIGAIRMRVCSSIFRIRLDASGSRSAVIPLFLLSHYLDIARTAVDICPPGQRLR